MPHVEKRGPGRWRARYRGPDGRERSRTFERKADAERFLAEMQVAKNRGAWVDPRAGRIPFQGPRNATQRASTCGIRAGRATRDTYGCTSSLTLGRRP